MKRRTPPGILLNAGLTLLLAMPAFAQWDAADPPEPQQPAAETATDAAPAAEDSPSVRGVYFPPGAVAAEQRQASAVDTDPPTILHQSPAAHERGRPLTLLANVVDRSGVASVTLYLRKEDKSGYTALAMVRGPLGLYEAPLGADATSVSRIEYYFEAYDARHNGPARFGSAQEPIVARTHMGATGGGDGSGLAAVSNGLTVIGLVSAMIVLGGAGLKIRDRQARRRVADQLFWTRTLLPLLGLRAEGLTWAITELTKQPLVHPIDGERYYKRGEILKRLDHVKGLRLDRLANLTDKYRAEELRPRRKVTAPAAPPPASERVAAAAPPSGEAWELRAVRQREHAAGEAPPKRERPVRV